jgi:Xaa-Pro aminopeptidase
MDGRFANMTEAIDAKSRNAVDQTSRRDEVEDRFGRLKRLIESKSLAGLVLFEPASMTWLTAGEFRLDPHSDDGRSFIFINPSARCLVCAVDQTLSILNHLTPELGFQVKEYDWREGHRSMLQGLVGNSAVGADRAEPGLVDLSRDIAPLRRSMSPYSIKQYRMLATQTCAAIEEVGRTVVPNVTRAQLMGELSRRLLSAGLIPVRIEVRTDVEDKSRPDGTPSFDLIKRFCVMTVYARRFGMTYGASRAIAFDDAPESFRTDHQKALEIAAAAARFTSPAISKPALLNLLKSRFAQAGEEFGWRDRPPAFEIGRVDRIAPFKFEGEEPVIPGTTIAWTPDICDAKAVDVVISLDEGLQTVHYFYNWPTTTITVGEVSLKRPAVLDVYMGSTLSAP